MRSKYILLVIFLLSVLPIISQEVNKTRQLIIDMLEPIAEKELERVDLSELVEDLFFLYEHPLNLNTVSQPDLERIPFLTDFQIENILFYVYNNGPMLTIYELSAVEGLSMETIHRIIPFVTVSATLQKKRSSGLKGNVLIRSKMLLQTPEGYQGKDEFTGPVFQGSNVNYLSKVRLNFNDQVLVGMTLEKDYGEPAFNSQIPFTDFSSGYIMIRNEGAIRKLIIGDYQASFGQGLGIWTGMAFSKGGEAHLIRRRAKGLGGYTSVNEDSYFRGAGVELGWKKLSFSILGSYKKRDGTLSGDSAISNIRDGGYHRTETEISYRNNITESIIGGVVAYDDNKIHAQGGVINWHIDKPMVAGNAIMDRFKFSGKQMIVSFATYQYFFRRFILFGELALQNGKAPALFNGITINPGADINLSFSYRNYSSSFINLYNNPFSESSGLNGESGVYAGMQCMPFKRVKLNAYIDLFRYKWLKHQTDAPSEGFESFAQIDYDFSDLFDMSVRFKQTQKELNKLNTEKSDLRLTWQNKTSLRWQGRYEIKKSWWLQMRLEKSFFHEENGHASNGFLISQDVKHRFWNNKITTGIRLAHFDTDDYYSRIYIYEPDMLYAFTVPSYSGRGTRWLVNVSIKPIKNLQIWGRVGHTYYSGKESIGSGLNTIEGNKKTEIKVQLQYKM
ncbi:helix-hairpin-helix domain-containing protein [Marinilabiliaceae bacterium JC017]|nr:helix-hairpin-helix domain-containing protein [Marinilabiliaceae bacterium JC017]